MAAVCEQIGGSRYLLLCPSAYRYLRNDESRDGCARRCDGTDSPGYTGVDALAIAEADALAVAEADGLAVAKADALAVASGTDSPGYTGADALAFAEASTAKSEFIYLETIFSASTCLLNLQTSSIISKTCSSKLSSRSSTMTTSSSETVVRRLKGFTKTRSSSTSS